MNFNKLLLWLLTLLWFIAGAWWYSHSSCSTCNAEPTVAAAPAVSCPSFAFSDGSFSQNNAENFRYVKSTDVPIVSTSMQTSFDEIAKYAAAQNPSRLLTVTGQYSTSEKNSSTFTNLGLARAEAIKKMLVAKGVAEKNIVTASELKEDLCYSNASNSSSASASSNTADTLTGGILFNMAAAQVAAVVPQIVTVVEKPKTLFEPRTVYFNTGQNTLNITKELDDYLKKADVYLKENKDKNLLITGHTDNVGDAAKNVTLSANRAIFVKGILSKRGIADSQMKTEGKGMAEPIAENTTDAGKAKNRRVTIVLQ